jgi:hypothetical protein
MSGRFVCCAARSAALDLPVPNRQGDRSPQLDDGTKRGQAWCRSEVTEAA